MRFIANYTNKVDRKGRVSVPARFRGELQASRFPGIVVYESFKLPCLEGSAREYIDALADRLSSDFGAFDDEKEALAAAILGAAFDLPFDSEGRILLPQPLLDFAGITDQAVFVGVGEKFLIWAPEAWERYRDEQRQKARAAAMRLGALGRLEASSSAPSAADGPNGSGQAEGGSS